MWKPLHHPLPPPEPLVPFIKLISSTGLKRTSQLNIKANCVKPTRFGNSNNNNNNNTNNIINGNTNNDNDLTVTPLPRNSSSSKADNFYQNLSKELSSLSNFKSDPNLNDTSHHSTLLSSIHNKINSKDNSFNDDMDLFSSNQYLLQNNIFNQLMMSQNPSSLSHNSSNSNNNNNNNNNNSNSNNLGVLSPYFSNVLNSHNGGPFNNIAPPVTVNLNSMFPSGNSNSNSLQLPNLSLPSQLFYDSTAHLLFSNNSQMSYAQNPVLAACASLSHPTGMQHQPYNHILLANRFEPTNPEMSWNNAFQWKF